MAVACNRNGADPTNDSLLGNKVQLQTKGNGSGRAFLFYLDGLEGTSTGHIETYGTYYDAVASAPLVPCFVSQDGNYTGEAPSGGLHARDGRYKLFIASPAVLPVTVQGLSVKGYEYERNLADPADPDILYVSEPVEVSVSGVFLSSGNGYEYDYDVSTQVLRQPRSRINLRFACGDKITETTLRKITLKNIIDYGYYIPSEAYFEYDSVIDKVVFSVQEGGEGLRLEPEDDPVDLQVNEYILSMDYRVTDDYGNYIWPLPSLEIKVGPDDENVVTFVTALGWNFKPQYVYDFTITINSVLVNLSVTAQEWEIVDGQEAVVGVPQTWMIEFPLVDNSDNKLLDWEKVDGGTGVIG